MKYHKKEKQKNLFQAEKEGIFSRRENEKLFISLSLSLFLSFVWERVSLRQKRERREDNMTRTTRWCCLRNLSRLAFAMENAASTSAASSSSSSFSETTRRLFHHQRARTTRKGTTVVPSSSIATASRVAEHKHKDDNGKDSEDDDVKTIAVTFTEKTGEEITVRAKVGESLMEAAHENDVELEGRIFVLLFSRCEEREREEGGGVYACVLLFLSLVSRARFRALGSLARRVPLDEE